MKLLNSAYIKRISETYTKSLIIYWLVAIFFIVIFNVTLHHALSLKINEIDTLQEIIKQNVILERRYQPILEESINTTYRYNHLILFGNLLVVSVISLLIIFPLFRRIHLQLLHINASNAWLQEKQSELEESRLAAFSMMEDAHLARLEAEKSRDAAQQLAMIVESSNDAIIGKNLDGIITSWNSAAEELYEYTKKEAIGQPIQLIVPEHKRKELTELILKQIRTGKKIERLETVRKKKSGMLVDVSLAISPIRDQNGKLIGASSIARDITEIKQARLALENRAEWFKALIENSTDLLIQLDKIGTIVYISPSVKRILGYTVEEKIGKSIFEFIHPQDLNMIQTIFQQIIQEENRLVSAQCRVLHKDGSWRWFEGIGQNLLNNHAINAIVANCRDITERKLSEEALKQEKDKAQQYLDIAEVMLLALNEHGEITLINKKGLSILGYDNERELLGKNWFDTFIPQEERAIVKKVFSRLMKGQIEVAEYSENYIISQDGKRKLIAWHNTAITQVDGQRLGTLSSGEDITQRKLDEQKLKQYTQDLKESNQELEQFAFVASHDLQEPVRIVSSYIQLFSKRYQSEVDETAQKYIQYIVDNNKRIQDMIASLLKYSRVGRKAASPHKIDSTIACEQAISNLKLSIAQKEAIVNFKKLPEVFANETELLQIFQNLISNAIKYCSKKKPVVSIEAHEHQNEWVFTVSDNGIGIEPEYSEKIFEIFKRLHTKSEYPGTGIGLAICKKIVEKNRGRIWVESTPGQGSKFHFTIPKASEVAYEYQSH